MPATEHSTDPTGDEQLFKAIARDLRDDGYSINPHALPPMLAHGLSQLLLLTPSTEFAPGGIGRAKDKVQDQTVRTDNIRWITADSAACRQWLQWTGELQRCLNQQLFLGLFSFESHFAHYRTGDFYRRHLDAFKGEENRVLSVVAYLNPDWSEEDGGELVLYPERGGAAELRVTPAQGTLVLFLSEHFEHEVLPARRDRFSIAGWFRQNNSSASRADPPA